MKKTLLTLTAALGLMFTLNLSANACHFEDVELTADCIGFFISGKVCADWAYREGAEIAYSLSVNGEEAVSGEIFWQEDLDGYSCESFEISGSWINLPCGDLLITGNIEWIGTKQTVDLGPIPLSCPCNPGTGTPGYWKNHPDAWPIDEIVVGGQTYTKEEAIAAMKKPVKKDKTITMFRALVSAKLNVLIGNDASCVADTISAADEWMEKYGPVGSGVKASSMEWKDGEPLYWILDDYNNGLLCAPHRD